MQETNITFQGINLSTPPDTCPDGQLESCVGLEMHDGSLRPAVLQGSEYSFTSPEGVTLNLVHRHSTNSYDNFIFQGSDYRLYWAPEQSEMTPVMISSDFVATSSASSVGNIMIIQTVYGPIYYLFKDGNYTCIGQKLPEISIAFGLDGQAAYYQTYEEASFTGRVFMGEYHIDDTERAYDAAFGAINALVEGKKDLIFYPFFIRAAYRYTDGTHSMFSSPVLLVPDSRGPRAFLEDAVYVEENNNGIVTLSINGKTAANAMGATIAYRILSDNGIDKWKDLIAGVDIYMTIPSSPIDTKQMVGQFGFASSMPKSWGQYKYEGKYIERDFPYIDTSAYFLMPQKETTAYLDELLASSQFYLAKSFTLDEYKAAVSTQITTLELDVEIKDLPFAETLKEAEDYRMHDMIQATGSFMYNSRLHLYGLSRKPFEGFRPEHMWPIITDGTTIYTIDVYLKQPDGQSVIVRRSTSDILWNRPVSRFYYYPDTSATRMVIYDADGNPVLDLPLKPHPMLNGSYYLTMGSLPPVTAETPSMPEVPLLPSISEKNKFMVSQAENPFIFPVGGTYTLGGDILGLSSIVTPLSQGQFGAFDLMIFTSEGNYAASVTDEGSYSTIRPMQRDVCINPSAIVPTDYSILFLSAKGLMSANGSVIECLSQELDGIFPGGEIPNMPAFFASCHIAYDYAGQRIILTSSRSPYALLRSASGLWSMAEWDRITNVMNIFPYTYLQRGSSIVRLDKPYDAGSVASQLCTLVTRPLKLGSLQFKHIHQLSVEGVLGEMEDMTIYASRDAVTWYKIGTTTSPHIRRMAGRSFKYWKIEICMHLNGQQNISGLRLQVQHRKETRYR